MRLSFLAFLLIGLNASAQVDLPVFGPQEVINGYAKDIKGEVLSYFSVYPEHATTALLTRCTDGKKAMAWETAAVPNYPQRERIPYYYFSWIAAHNSTTCSGDRAFDLYINDQLALTFTTHHNAKPASWSAAGTDSTKLVFGYSKMDRHGDAHGFAHLRVPAKYITPGQPLRLKIVGHAQDSPDWFMTFRYTFERKVEMALLPFVFRNGRTRALQFTTMEFGRTEQLEIWMGDTAEGRVHRISPGLHVLEAEIPSEEKAYDLRVSYQLGQELEAVHSDTVIHVEPIPHRDIYLVHHSHNDIGYSHPQPEVERIQNTNIYDALDLIDRTRDYTADSRFKWNSESLWAVENFLGQCSERDKQRFIAAVKSGSIALSANYANILTGLCTPEEMHWIVEYADSLKKWYGLPINTAMQTDIPGMSWSMVDAYAGHGIRYLSQGPNYIPDLPDGGDRIGSTLRAQGDKPYWWKGTTGKDSILVWTAGQGYGGWHGFTPGAIKERGTQKIADYMNELTANGYPYDMVQWRYNIVSDNGPVDSTLSDFVRSWNERYSSPHLIIANVNDMMAAFERKYGKQIPTWSGDFTSYWEDGAYSTAKEEGEVRVLSARLSNLMDAAKILGKPIDPHLLYRAKRSIVMWHEHTWGAWNSIDAPDDPAVIAQWNYKKAFADSAAWYVAEIEARLFPTSTSEQEIVVLNTLPYDRSGYVLFKTPAWMRSTWMSNDRGTANRMQHFDNGRSIFIANDVSGERQRSFAPRKGVDRITHDVLGGRYVEIDAISGGVAVPWTGHMISDTSAQLLAIAWMHVAGLDPDSVTGQLFLEGGTIDEGSLVYRRTEPAQIDGTKGLMLDAYGMDSVLWLSYSIEKEAVREKESLHLELPLNIPNATVRIGISDTCITPESGRIPGSNNDFFCAQRWIDISNDSMGVTIVCPQGALWEVGDLVDERKTVPGRGSNAEHYKAWKTSAKSSSTLYLYALNNYWHTNFKADQEGPITFDLYLKVHGKFSLDEARRFGLEMTRPLITWWK